MSYEMKTEKLVFFKIIYLIRDLNEDIKICSSPPNRTDY